MDETFSAVRTVSVATCGSPGWAACVESARGAATTTYVVFGRTAKDATFGQSSSGRRGLYAPSTSTRAFAPDPGTFTEARKYGGGVALVPATKPRAAGPRARPLGERARASVDPGQARPGSGSRSPRHHDVHAREALAFAPLKRTASANASSAGHSTARCTSGGRRAGDEADHRQARERERGAPHASAARRAEVRARRPSSSRLSGASARGAQRECLPRATRIRTGDVEPPRACRETRDASEIPGRA